MFRTSLIVGVFVVTASAAQAAPQLRPPVKPRPLPTPAAENVSVPRFVVSGACGGAPHFEIEIKNGTGAQQSVRVHFDGPGGEAGAPTTILARQTNTFSVTPDDSWHAPAIQCGSEAQCWNVWLSAGEGTAAKVVSTDRPRACAVNPPGHPVRVQWTR